MAQKFISFYYIEARVGGDYLHTNIRQIHRLDPQFTNIETQDTYIKEHNLIQRTALRVDDITYVDQVSGDMPVFFIHQGPKTYYLSYNEGNKLIDSLLTINDYKK